MKNIKMPQIFKDVTKMASKHSPEILTGFGVGGMFVTTIEAIRATPKAIDILEEKKRETGKEKLSAKEVIQSTWKCYIPTIGTFLMSSACLIGATTVNNRQKAALVTGCKLTETAFNEYKTKVEEIIGEKKAQEIKSEIVKDRIIENSSDTKDIVVVKRDGILICDPFSATGACFKTSKTAFDDAINRVNYLLNTVDYASLSDLYDELGLKHTSISDKIGWSIYRDGLVSYVPTWGCNDDHEPCMIPVFNVDPRINFDMYE